MTEAVAQSAERRDQVGGKDLLFSVVICTYNRSALLVSCLESLAAQSADQGSFEVLVIDNNSTDGTAQAAAPFAASFSQFRVIREARQGLSNARNRGWQEARGAYVAYLDDDARAYPEWVSAMADFVRRRPAVEAFGGPYDAFSLVPRPGWFPPEYGCLDLGDDERDIRIGSEWISGSNMIFSKGLLRRFGGFNAELGMQGDRLGYGEETDLLLTLRDRGIAVFYVPSVKVSHLVRAEKMRLAFLLQTHFIGGRSHCLTFKEQLSLGQILLSLAATGVRGAGKIAASGGVPVKRRLYYGLSPLCAVMGVLAQYFATSAGRKNG